VHNIQQPMYLDVPICDNAVMNKLKGHKNSLWTLQQSVFLFIFF